MSQISLTASMRSNLLSLQNTSKLMNQTQERLSTGKKVNSAIDNPSSYYTAQSLNNRANDLSSLLDSMGQAISTIKAASEGIESITAFVEQAKAVANSALETTDISARTTYAAQFDAIMDQIDKLKDDSGYKGINLLNGGSLTVTFNEGRTNQLTITGETASFSNLGLTKAAATWTATEIAAAKIQTPDVSVETTGANAKKIVGGASSGDIIKYGTEYYKATDTIAENALIDAPATQEKLHKLTKVGEKYYDTEAIDEVINTAISAAHTAISTLRGYASKFGNNFSIVQTREEFTNNLINVLEEGADKLTLADMNEESANMLALQTRQQLAINSLSLASQASQSVLKLF